MDLSDLDNYSDVNVLQVIVPTLELDSAPKEVLKSIATYLTLLGKEVTEGDTVRQERAMKAFLLLPRWLLHSPAKTMHQQDINILLSDRISLLFKGKYRELDDDFQRMLEGRRTSPPAPASDDKRFKSASSLLRKGDIGKAMDALAEDTPLADLSDPRTLESLKKVFPQVEELELPRPRMQEAAQMDTATVGPEPDVFEPTTRDLSLQDIKNAITSSNMHKAAGPSGWRVDHLRVLLQYDALWSIAIFINTLRKGQGSELFQKMHTTASVTLLAKVNGGVRPIAVMEALTRVWSRALVCKHQHEMAPALRQFQYGINSKGGAQHVPTLINIRERPGDVIIKTDVTNAYGSVSRNSIFQALQAQDSKFSPLVDYVAAIYGRPNLLLLRGNHIQLAHTGILQGDPMAPLLFCMAIHSVIEAAKEQIPNGNIYAFIDDVTIVGDPIEAVAATQVLLDGFASLGMKINFGKNKSKMYAPRDVSVVLPPSLQEMEIVHDGLVVLGTPIGTPDFVDSFVNEKVTELKEKIMQVRNLPSLHEQYVLLRFSLMHTLTHLWRTTPQQAGSGGPAQEMDLFIREIERMINVANIPKDAVEQILLPLRMGGLGFDLGPHHAGAAFYANFLDCVVRNNVSCEEVHAFIQSDVPSARVLRAFEQILTSISPTATPLQCYLQARKIDTQDLQSRVAEQLAKVRLYSLLPLQDLLLQEKKEMREKEMERYRRLTSLGKSDSLACLSAVPFTKQLYLQDEDFSVMLKRILGLPLIPASLAQAQTCVCNQKLTSEHVQVCLKTYKVNQRHNALRDFLAWMAQQARFQVSVEYGTGTGQRYDLMVTDGDQYQQYLDVTVVHPCQQELLKPKNLGADAPVLLANQRKAQQYKSIMQTLPSGTEITPMVFESFGAPSEAVRNFIRRCSERLQNRPPRGAPWTTRTFSAYCLQVMSAITHKISAKVVNTTIQAVLDRDNATGYNAFD